VCWLPQQINQRVASCTSVGGKRHSGTLGSVRSARFRLPAVELPCGQISRMRRMQLNAVCSLQFAARRLHGQLIMHRQPAFCRQNSSSTFWRSLRSGARGKCCAKSGWQLKHVVALALLLLLAGYMDVDVDVDVAPAAMTHRWRRVRWPRVPVHTLMCAANRLSTELQLQSTPFRGRNEETFW